MSSWGVLIPRHAEAPGERTITAAYEGEAARRRWLVAVATQRTLKLQRQ